MRLSVLGETGLSRGGHPVATVLAQPKRLALLAYLALGRPGSFQRRDHLLGLFWPTSRPDRARANLRQAVRFLRKALGSEVIVGRGDGELAVDGDVLTSDAVDFRAALERRDLTVALELYRGVLLPGLFVSGAPDFEHWLSRERRELREGARDAAITLAERAESEADWKEAVEWARRAVELDPLDEVAVRRLMGSLDQSGRRSEAVAAYEALEERLATELGLDPAPATRALIAGLRDSGTSDDAPAVSGEPDRELDPRRVAVLPYRPLIPTPGHETLGAMAADWVAQGLAHNPELSIVPPIVARGAGGADGPASEGTAPSGAAGEDPLTGLADALRVGTLVTGTIEKRGSEFVFRTSVFDALQRRLLPPPDAVSSPGPDPVEALPGLSDAVSGHLAPLLSTQPGHPRQAARPPSFEGYRSYLAGLDLFIAGDWTGALAEFRRASDREAGYALPRIVSAIALWNLGRLPEAREVATQARALRESVGPFERGTLDMVLGWLEGDWRAAYAGTRRQADLAPGSLPSVQVAEEARRLNRPREARDILLGLDPSSGELRGWLFYWVELCTAHHLLGDHGEELATAREAVSRHPGHTMATLLEVRALAGLGDLLALADLGSRILATPSWESPSPGALLRRIALELAAHGHTPEDRRYLEMSEEWWQEQGPIRDPVHRRERALTLYHLDRLEEAREALLSLRTDGPEAVPALDEHHGHLRGHLDEGYLALIAERLGDAQEADRWRAYLQDLDEPFLYGAKWLWLAALSTRARELDRGVSQVRRALVDGLPFSLVLHTMPELEPLRDHPGFRAILAPKG